MPDALLILAPLFVLAVILLLGFAGCGFESRLPDPPPTPMPALTFRARVPNTLEVLAPGVRFFWTRPGTAMEETANVAAPTGTDGAINVFDHPVPSPEAGGWMARCQLEAQEGGVPMGATPDTCPPFDLPAMDESYVVLFETEGSPVTPPFRVRCRGRMP